MPCRIVKPYDWQFIRTGKLDIVLEDLDQPGCVVRVFSYETYFQVAVPDRIALAQANVTPLPQGIARATVSGIGCWGPCVLSVVGPDGVELTAAGVKFGTSEVSNWVSGAESGTDGFQYPLEPAGSAVSHTPADRQPELPLLPDLSALCDKIPDMGSSIVGAVTMSEPRSMNGLDSLSLLHSLGKDDPAFSAMLENGRWTTNVPYVARFRDAVVQMPSGLVMFDGMVWSDSTVTAFFNDPDLRQQSALFRARGQVGTMGGFSSSREILEANGLEKFPGLPLLLSNVGYRNHAHWIMNSMLAAYYCRDLIKQKRVCVLVPEYNDYIFASLMSLGIGRESIVVVPKGFYRLHDVLFPSTLSTHVNRAPPPEIAGMFDMIRDHGRARLPRRGPRLVYFTRKGSGAARKISNEDELIAALKQRGFVCIAPHELSFEEEVSCVSGAAVVVGQLGAAMMNIAFAPRDAWVVELASHNYTSADYWVLATTLGQRFVRILTRAESEETLTLTDFSFEIPLTATLSSIDRIIDQLGTPKPTT